MRGGYLHSQVMARQLKEALERLGARVRTEYPAGSGRRAGAVDLYVELHGVRIACEIELGPRRLLQDLRKAEALGVDLLLVVGPTPAVAKAIRRRLATLPKSNLKVRVLLNASVVSYLSKMSPVEGRGDKKTETDQLRSAEP
jgi:hypothetical protein